jgi:hypothetical protein
MKPSIIFTTLLLSCLAQAFPKVLLIRANDTITTTEGKTTEATKANKGYLLSDLASDSPDLVRNSLDWEYNYRWGGESIVTLYDDGDARFYTHFHTAGLSCYHVVIVCGLRDADGRAYIFQREANIAGTLCHGSTDDCKDIA